MQDIDKNQILMVQAEMINDLTKENKELKIVLIDVLSVCVGQISMGVDIDPHSLGLMINERTGLTAESVK